MGVEEPLHEATVFQHRQVRKAEPLGFRGAFWPSSLPLSWPQVQAQVGREELAWPFWPLVFSGRVQGRLL
jgi:hypothetical protein